MGRRITFVFVAVFLLFGDPARAAIKIDPGQIEAAKKLSFDRLSRGDDAIRVKVTNCVGEFRIRASLLTIKKRDYFWGYDVKEREIGGLLVSDAGQPALPDPKKFKGRRAYLNAKNKYEKDMKGWPSKFRKQLERSLLKVPPQYWKPGDNALRLRIVLQRMTGSDWRISLSSDLNRKKKKKPYLSWPIPIERTNAINQSVGKEVSDERLYFHLK